MCFLPLCVPGPDIPGFLLQPFRKPKRIRTAFSPSQLLKLEHAFEKNHYVVGAERKQLAQALSLTETQVTSSIYSTGSFSSSNPCISCCNDSLIRSLNLKISVIFKGIFARIGIFLSFGGFCSRYFTISFQNHFNYTWYR